MRVGANQYSDVSFTAAGTAAKNTDYPNMMFVPLKTSSPIVMANPLAFSACPATANPLALPLVLAPPAHLLLVPRLIAAGCAKVPASEFVWYIFLLLLFMFNIGSQYIQDDYIINDGLKGMCSMTK